MSYKPTAYLRLLYRGANDTQPVLQQLWTSEMEGEQDQWRDVPAHYEKITPQE